MEAIVLSFVFKGLSDEEFGRLSGHIKAIAEKYEDPVILIHGHMPRKLVEQKGFDTKLCDLLDENFPIQLNMFYEKTLRQEMAEIAWLLDADIYVIGEIKDGVAEEIKLFEKEDCDPITYIEL